MFKKLLFALAIFSGASAFSQEVEIAGDTMLCPNSNGTAYVVNDIAIDSYQWMVRDAFTSQPFEPIDGATDPTFTYSSYEYSVKEIRLDAVVMGDILVSSNILLIDSMVFLPIYTITEDSEDISINPENGGILLCEGGSFTVSIGMPYTTNIKWFLNGEVIASSGTSLEITGPGEYWVSAAPQDCPEYTQTSLPIVVTIDPDCQLSVPGHQTDEVSVFPNPVTDRLSFSNLEGDISVELFSVSGRKILTNRFPASQGLDLSGLASGVYVLKLLSEESFHQFKIVKE